MKPRKDRKKETAWQAVLHEVSKDRFESIWVGLPEGLRKKATGKDLAQLVIFIHGQLEVAGKAANVEMIAKRSENLAARASRFLSERVAMFADWKKSFRITEDFRPRLSVAAVAILAHVRSRFGR